MTLKRKTTVDESVTRRVSISQSIGTKTIVGIEDLMRLSAEVTNGELEYIRLKRTGKSAYALSNEDKQFIFFYPGELRALRDGIDEFLAEVEKYEKGE